VTRLLLVPLAALTLIAGLVPLGAALLGVWHGVAGGVQDVALAHALRAAGIGCAVAAPVAVLLGLAGALAIWRAPAWLRFAVCTLCILVLLVPAPGFMTIDFLAPPRPASALAFACAVARGAALALLVLAAGLRRIPATLQRAALLAGATPGQAWRHAVLAPLRPDLALALVAAALAALAEGPAGGVLAPHLDRAEAWIAPAALLLVAGSAAALSVLLRRTRA
jgi:ABC-type spermidine/putrescine transport system permease subunit II